MQDATLAEDKPGSPRALIKLSLENYDAAAMASTRQAPPVPAPGLNGVKNVMCDGDPGRLAVTLSVSQAN